jgi:hypothetical protein
MVFPKFRISPESQDTLGNSQHILLRHPKQFVIPVVVGRRNFPARVILKHVGSH